MTMLLTTIHILAANDSTAPVIFTGIFGIILFILLLFMAVLTFLMPFYVFAINSKLAKLNRTAEAMLQAQNNTTVELFKIRTGQTQQQEPQLEQAAGITLV